MTPLSREILDNYQVRKTRKQNAAFAALLRQHFPELKMQEGGFPKCRNLIIGDVETAKVVLSAHYDTCAQLPIPNFIAPKNPLLSIAYSVALVIPMFAAVYLLNLLLNLITDNYWLHYWLSLAAWFGLLALMICGPANKNTANDNTSGVITLCELLGVLTQEERSKAAFVFFDHEETGLIGSSLFRSRYKKQMKDKLLINFDCVSDGDTIMLAISKSARAQYGALFDESFQPTDTKSIILTKAEKTYYPSDQMGFPKTAAIAALKRKRVIGYYMDRIHTAKDTVFEKENIKLLCDSILKLLKKL